MLRRLKKNLLGILSTIYALLVALFWTALRVNYAGISKFLGADTNPSFLIMYLPVLVCVFLWLLFVYAIFGWAKNNKTYLHSIISLVLSVIFTGAIGAVIYFGSQQYLSYILPHFYKSVIVASVLLIFIVELLFVEESGKGAMIIKTIVAFIAVVLTVVISYQLKSNRFRTDSVIYAVEDNYQIVFSTTDNSLAWVEIGNQKYYDLYAGSMKSKDLVHKVTVPMDVLDKSGSYTIKAQQLIYRGPFGAYKGKVIEQKHDFHPVNSADGVQYYVLADVHESFDGAIAAASYHSDLDFLVLVGDMVSMVEFEKDADAVNRMASEITKGEIPVVYARGNHEIKGEMAEDLYKYVGSNNQKFYYTFSFGKDIKGIVLDLGEDHDDDWWEYFESAQFDLYRNEQTAFLEQLIREDYFKDAKYKMVVCHIPITFVNYRKNHSFYKEKWTRLLNTMDIDILLSGHQHDLTIFEPGKVTPYKSLTYNKNYSRVDGKTYSGYLTDHQFYAFMVARCANQQTGDTGSNKTFEYTGMSVFADLIRNQQTVTYTNSQGETVPVCNMFSTDEPVNKYVISRK